MSNAAAFKDQLTDFNDHYVSLGEEEGIQLDNFTA